MFDVFQNVLFGKKKTSAESEKDKSSDSDDFVLISAEQNSTKESETISNELLPKNPYSIFLTDKNFLPSPKTEEPNTIIMPLQDVPFTINSSLQASSKLEQIWKAVAPALSAITQSGSYESNYDFSLEKSVISETTGN